MNGDIADRITMVEVMARRLEAMRAELNAEAAPLAAGTRLPGFAGGQKLGYLTIPESKPRAEVTDSARLAEWAAEHHPDGVTVTVKTSWLSDPHLVDLVRAHLPGAVERVVRPSFLGDLRAAVGAYGGWPDEATGEIVPVPGMRKIPGGEPGSPRVTLDKDIREIAGAPRVPLPAGIADEARKVLVGEHEPTFLGGFPEDRRALTGDGDGRTG